MKKLAAGMLAATLFVASLPVLAGDWGGRRDRHERHDRHGYGQRHQAHPPHHRHHHKHYRPAPWAWGVAGVALGGAILTIEASRPPPPVVPPPGRLWYYCEAYGAYYPQVAYCPGGWRALP